MGVDKDETDVVADLATPEGRRRAVTEASERSGGSLSGIVTCAGLAGAPTRAGSLLAAVNYFGTVEVLEGLRPLLAQGGAAVAISSNSTTVQPAIPADLVEACLDHDETRSARSPTPRLTRGVSGDQARGGALGAPQRDPVRHGRARACA